MKMLITIFIYIIPLFLFAQETQFVLEGAIQVGNTTQPNPALGTIRWTGSDLEVYKDSMWVSLTGSLPPGSIQDIDGNSYMTVPIGNTIWMAENLRTTKFKDGSDIPLVENLTDWFNLSTPAFSWYDNDNSYESVYGKMYNWYAVEDARGLCPEGWHIPTNVEVSTMTASIGGDSVAGGKLKETGTDNWRFPNVGATDEYGFRAMPGGLKSTTFTPDKDAGFYWTSSPSGSSAYYYVFRYDQDDVIRSSASKRSGCSIRCVKD